MCIRDRFSITGGYVYRGSAIPDLAGTYFYADFVTNRIWSLEFDGANVQNFTERTSELDPPNGALGSISTFGQDNDGEIYIGLLSAGAVYKIVPATPDCGATNFCTALPHSTGATASIGMAGSSEMSLNNFALFASGSAPLQFGLFFYGPDQAQSPSGDGNICVGGNASTPLVRIPMILQSDVFGTVFLPLDLTDSLFVTGPAPITAGSTWNFQFWFRDVAPGGAASWNFTDGLSVLFCP